MRLFIAIEIPGEIKQEMADVQRRLRDIGVDAGWTRPEGIHLTLKFLGETPESKVPDILDALTRALGGTGGFRLEVERVGTFPNAKNARVVWVGVSGDIERLMNLQTAVEDAMAGLGLERDDRPFTPHLTLGRIKYLRSKEKWLNILEEIKNIKLAGFDVKAVALMKSELKRTGAVYTEIGRVELS
ncbi:MAG: RNA 2',3'-cyclic phosphodiesterase [Methanothrix sp.]|nr:RNA 2',3'-cyclic phosphodiesterase [Methanothrix sp.]